MSKEEKIIKRRETLNIAVKSMLICLILAVALYFATEVVKNIIILNNVKDDVCFTINNKLYCDFDASFVIETTRGDL